MADLVPFFDEEFTLVEKVGSMPLMRFAKTVMSGAGSHEVAGLAAMYELIESTVEPEDWERFQDCATKNRADDDDLLGFVGSVILATAARPTKRPSDSPDGPSNIEPSSTSTPADRAIAQLAGRPDLQLIIEKSAEALAS